jgi:phosphate transport system substrate-binding protein
VGTVVIEGAGATFPQPLYARWAAEYRARSGVEVQYEPVGSGEGWVRIQRRTVDFGASDVPLGAQTLRDAGLLQFPVTVGAVVPVVNIRGLALGELRLTGAVLGDIYLGRIRRWNDAAIAALNPGVPLPDANITVVHRADASGSTHLFSTYLSAANDRWREQVGTGTRLAWPVGVDALGNEGVAASVQRTRMSIGYVEHAYAREHQLGTVSLRNRDGVFVRPERAAFEAAAAAARWTQPADLLQSLGDAAGAASWPITGASFILLPLRTERPDRSLEVMKFFDWALHHGQAAARGLDYVPLPDAAVRLVEQAFGAVARGPGGAAVWPHP